MRIAAPVTLLLLGALAAACNLFVPIDDYELAPPGLGASDGGEPNEAALTIAEGGLQNETGGPVLGGDVVLLDKQLSPKEVIAVGGQLYWVNAGDQTIRTSPKTTPQAALLYTRGDVPRSLVQLDERRMAWCEGPALVYALLDGKSAGGRASFTYGALRVTVAPSHVYVVEGSSDLHEVGIETGSTKLATEPGLLSVAYGGAALFYASTTASRIMKFERPSGPGIDFARDQIGPADIVIDDTFVYWLTDVGVMKQDKSQPLGTAIALATNQPSPKRMVLDSTNVYWTNGGATSVMTVPKAGGSPTQIGSCNSAPFGIAVDGEGVYFTCPADGTVKMISKK